MAKVHMHVIIELLMLENNKMLGCVIKIKSRVNLLKSERLLNVSSIASLLLIM